MGTGSFLNNSEMIKTFEKFKSKHSKKLDQANTENLQLKVSELEQKIYQLESENAGLENAMEKMQDELINSKETEEEKANAVDGLKDRPARGA